MTFGEMLTRCYQDCGYAASPASDVTTRFKAWLNEGHRRLLRDARLIELRQSTFTFATTASQPVYGLQAMDRIDSITDAANSRKLQYMERDLFRRADPGETSTGTPSHWIPMGFSAVRIQPVNTALYLVSSSLSDTTPVVTIEGATGTRPALAVSATANGTTQVQFGTDTGWTYVNRFVVTGGSAAVGVLMLLNGSGTQLATIAIGASSAQYLGVRLWPTPTAAVTYTVDGQMTLPTLTNTNDIPLLPAPYHDILTDYARIKEYERTNDPRFMTAAAMWDDDRKKLLAFVEYPTDYRPIAGVGANAIGINNVGGWYPADR